MDFSKVVQLFLQARLLSRIRKVEEIAGIVIIRSGFAQVIEAGPDKFAGRKWIFVLAAEFRVRGGCPGRCIEIIRADLKVGAALRFFVAYGKEIFPTRTDTRSGFAAEQW